MKCDTCAFCKAVFGGNGDMVWDGYSCIHSNPEISEPANETFGEGKSITECLGYTPIKEKNMNNIHPVFVYALLTIISLINTWLNYEDKNDSAVYG